MKQLFKNIYNLIPNKLKLIFFYLIKNIFIPPEKLFQHLHFKGYFKIKFMDQNAYLYSIGTILENTIFWKGIKNAHEPLSLKIWFFLSCRSDEIIDIGANIGLYSIVSHMANYKSKIHAFEPSREFLVALKKIKIKNKIDLSINPFALGDKEEVVYFDGYRTTSDKKIKNYYSETINSKWKEIKQKKLSKYLEHNNINKIDLIKMDIEKYEYKVLKDIKERIKRDQPNMLIEIINNDEISKNNINDVIGKIIKDMNYKIYLIDDKNNIVSRSAIITYSTYWNVLFLNNHSSLAFEKNFVIN